MKTVKLFKVTCNHLTKSKEHFPISYNSEDNYFNWSESLEEKILEYNNIKILERFKRAEKILWFCEINKKDYKQITESILKKHPDAIETLCDWNYTEIKSDIIVS